MIETKFLNDARKFSPGWRVWFLLLQLVNLVGPLFFLGRPEALAVLGGYAASALVIIVMHRKLGWVRLLGVGHFFWFVILPWIGFRYMVAGPTGFFGMWILSVLIVNSFGLIIDVADVVRYLSGEQQPIV